MTSKEAIQELRVSLFNRYTDVRIIEAQCNILDKIEKDLEVLELILKNRSIIFAKRPNYDNMSEDDFLKLSEWLENEENEKD